MRRTAIGGLLIVLLVLSGCGSCSNEVLTETLSPDGTKRAVVFLRNCGATTDFSWQVSILGSREVLPNDGGNIFVADADHGSVQAMKLEVDWKSANNLIVSYPARARVFHLSTMVKGVTISYEKMKYPPARGV